MSRGLLDIARDELGVQEVPDGSNTSPRIRQYQRASWLAGTGFPWCSCFVLWSYAQAGRPLPYRSASAWGLGDWCKRQGWETRIPVTGDIVVFNIGSGHIALVESVTVGMVTSIDGNSGNRVSRNTRSRALVREFIHVPATHAVPAQKPPVREKVGSLTGHTQVVYVAPKAQAVKTQADRIARLLQRGKTVVLKRRG